MFPKHKQYNAAIGNLRVGTTKLKIYWSGSLIYLANGRPVEQNTGLLSV